MIRALFRRDAGSLKGHPDPEAPAVEARGLSKVYSAGAGQVAALRGVDLRIEQGELVAIVGPSGCGKTTLLNCLAGLDTGYEGEVLLAGIPLRHLSDDRRAGLRARLTGFIFQSFNLLPTLSAIENVELPLLIAGGRRAKGTTTRERAAAMLAAVGLADRLDHRPSALSGGQQQRVAIARALVNEPAIVWADEPTGNLDSDSAAEVMALIRQLNAERGRTFVIVTHAADVAGHASRIVRMRDGRVVADEGRKAEGRGLRAEESEPVGSVPHPPSAFRPPPSA
ncbi:MAG: ABC-type antimicrobial peptide transport system, ATPase component [uncultured Thermomicrobiales bacterium]|uniref:ABC-type antimicrobial peptide transport system, ATPase component n=1 Tax=uncultured Thermomicrobiales bacterium TaxID=1645740 RepID=A0A6J4VAQ3_9BACT|nr:MAG: ABC-type antimicrobial peptide transport system, ATPase component [uncultured Thermomicrobiales bacterium]